MKVDLIESEIPSRVTFLGEKLSFYSKNVYYKTKLSNPQHIIIVDENGKTVSSSSEELTPRLVISDNDIESIVEFYNRTGNLPDFYLFDEDV